MIDRELKEEEKPWIAFHQEIMALWLRDVPENWAHVNNFCSRAANGQPLFLLFPFYRTLDREIALSEIPRLTGTHPNGNRALTSKRDSQCAYPFLATDRCYAGVILWRKREVGNVKDVCIHGTIFVELARLHSFWHLYGLNYVFKDEATSNDRFLRGL